MKMLVAILCAAALVIVAVFVARVAAPDTSTLSSEIRQASESGDESTDSKPVEPDPKYPTCEPPSATEAQNSRIRVFTLTEDVEGIAEGETIICHKETGEWNFLFTGEWGVFPDRIRLSGDFLIAEIEYGCPDTCNPAPPVDYVLLNAKTGDDYRLEASDGTSEQFFEVGNAVVTNAGVVVYSVTRSEGSKNSEFYEPPAKDRPIGTEIVRFDVRSEKREVLGSGPGIDIKSLEANGSRVTWINAGTTRSAKL